MPGVYFNYLICLLSYLFSIKGKRYTAFRSLVQSHSYRIDAKDQSNRIAGFFRYGGAALRLILSRPPGPAAELVSKEKSAGGKALYCTLPWQKKTFLPYINYVDPAGVEFLVYRDLLSIPGFSRKSLSLFLFFLHAVLLFPFIIFSRNSRSLSLHLLELAEISALLIQLQKERINYLYYVRAYEKDANFTAWMLQRKNIYVHKIPSSNPIANFYGHTIADAFSFTAPFQVEEYERIKKDWFVDKVQLWPNFNAPVLQSYFIEKNPVSAPATIGLFTRGIWLRKEKGDSFLGVGEDLAEESMLAFVKRYLNETPQLQLAVFLHPVEKSTEEGYARAANYYRSFFNPFTLTVGERESTSYESFSKCEIGLASVSSVNAERLFCGFKAFYVTAGIKVPFFKGTRLEDLSIATYDEFRNKMNESFRETPAAFFERYRIVNYKHE